MEGSKLQNPKVGLHQTSQVVFGLQRRILLSRNIRRELVAFKGKSKTISFQYEEVQSKNPGELIRKKLGAFPSHLKHLSNSFRFKVDSKMGRRETILTVFCLLTLLQNSWQTHPSEQALRLITCLLLNLRHLVWCLACKKHLVNVE